MQCHEPLHPLSLVQLGYGGVPQAVSHKYSKQSPCLSKYNTVDNIRLSKALQGLHNNNINQQVQVYSGLHC